MIIPRCLNGKIQDARVPGSYIHRIKRRSKGDRGDDEGKGEGEEEGTWGQEGDSGEDEDTEEREEEGTRGTGGRQR